MARVHVDVCVFGKSWFNKIYDDLVKSENVIFTYSPSSKFIEEHEKATNAAKFYKLMKDMGKREDADADDVQEHSNYLESFDEWNAERDCDDPHIFSLVFVKPTKYIITSDEDIANCRRCINRVVNKRYCNFRLICSEANYNHHKNDILT